MKIGVLAISFILFAAGTIANEQSPPELPSQPRLAVELQSGQAVRMPWVGENDAPPVSAVSSDSQIESEITSTVPAIEEIDASGFRHD